MPPADSPFIRFLILRSTAFAEHHRLDAGSQLVLETLYLRAGFYSDKPTVGQILLLSGLGSRASIHKRLQSLIAKKYICLLSHPVDSRMKQVGITHKGESFLAMMDEAVVLASNTTPPLTTKPI
jgi:DNA-binding MarR family transcriptional regulator